MNETGVGQLPQLRGTARLTPCPECAQPHGIVYRLGQTPVIECPSVSPAGAMLLRLYAPVPTIVVGAPQPDPPKPRRPA